MTSRVTPWLLVRVREVLAEELHRPPTVAELAAELDLSRPSTYKLLHMLEGWCKRCALGHHYYCDGYTESEQACTCTYKTHEVPRGPQPSAVIDI